ncbi:sugar ABC transporter substrate-binding protein [Murimonas intestini]|uniref:ABC-type sugar transport system substrate-binding protein n=1 Tax=Murimonas intestini TaxID=1337051 RepID=A0AB73T346_9FIRM|nr:substrate-binding domain-containing protein [Murimonas intestini]MCR1841544.1 substrate-binding domain-containing protein [Murimonas intestini]MCR1867050.1 substrate-binding domain-containing protein [Murimonas intestini]MCR1884073.1 substrate-binding domain-containing protein [Murimonas intestini]
MKRLTAVLLAGAVAVSQLAGCSSGSQSKTEKTTEKAAKENSESVAEGGTEASEAEKAADTKDSAETEKTADAGDGAKADEPAADVDLKEITIAIPMADTGMTFQNQMSYNMNNILGPAGNATFVYNQSTFDADGTMNFVESEIAAGVDGLMFVPPSDSVLPTVCSLCEEAEVYWAISMRTIEDEEIREMCENSPYYVGNCYEDEEETGRLVGEYLGKQGAKKIAIITTIKGDTTGEAREAGLAKACEEYGIEIVGEARGLTQASDVTNAVESFLSANAELDAVFCVGTTVTGVQEITVKAVQDSGRKGVQVVCVDHPDGITDLFESGTLTYSIGTPSFALDTYICAIKMVNAIQGYPISGEKEGKSSNFIAMAVVSNAEEAKVYEEASSNNEYTFFDEKEIKDLLRWNNPQLDESGLQSVLDNYEL